MVPNKPYRQSVAAAFTLLLLFLLMAFARPALAQSVESPAKIKAQKLSFSPGKLNFGDGECRRHQPIADRNRV